MENIPYNFQCGIRKGFNAQQCLISMIEKAKRAMDKDGHFNASKLNVYGFKNDALCLIFNYLNIRKQKVKTNSLFSYFQNIINGVPRGSLLGLS